MHIPSKPTAATGLVLLLASSLLGGCAHQREPLYYWGSYQTQVYAHLSKQTSPEAQRLALEADREKARALGKPLPPGYQAHLGLLYGESGQLDGLRQHLEAEKAQFPESAGFVDFLLKKMTP